MTGLAFVGFDRETVVLIPVAGCGESLRHVARQLLIDQIKSWMAIRHVQGFANADSLDCCGPESGEGPEMTTLSRCAAHFGTTHGLKVGF